MITLNKFFWQMILIFGKGCATCHIFFHQNPVGNTVFFFIKKAFRGTAPKRHVSGVLFGKVFCGVKQITVGDDDIFLFGILLKGLALGGGFANFHRTGTA